MCRLLDRCSRHWCPRRNCRGYRRWPPSGRPSLPRSRCERPRWSHRGRRRPLRRCRCCWRPVDTAMGAAVTLPRRHCRGCCRHPPLQALPWATTDVVGAPVGTDVGAATPWATAAITGASQAPPLALPPGRPLTHPWVKPRTGRHCTPSSRHSSMVFVTPHISKPHDFVNHMFMRP
jgi:hypothetical protein